MRCVQEDALPLAKALVDALFEAREERPAEAEEPHGGLRQDDAQSVAAFCLEVVRLLHWPGPDHHLCLRAR